MDVRVPRLAYIAVAAILSGIALPYAYSHWLETRTFLAVDMPVSLSRGHLKTSDFSVNLEGWYHITADVDSGFSGCQSGVSHFALESRSTVYSDGQPIEHSEGLDRYLGHFYATKRARYSVDLQVLNDPTCLNAGHPRIMVWTESSTYESLYSEVQNIAWVIVFVGLGLLAFSTTRFEQRTGERDPLSISKDTWCSYYPSRRKLPLRVRFQVLPPFGLSYAAVLTALLLPAALVFIYAWGWDKHSLGIQVSVLKVGPLSLNAGPTNLHPVVRLEDAGTGAVPLLYMNSKLVPWNELADVLTHEIKVGPDWIVYVQADENVSWSDVINAMDIIRSRHARIVLLTTTTQMTRAVETLLKRQIQRR
jgi:hypothetical protein